MLTAYKLVLALAATLVLPIGQQWVAMNNPQKNVIKWIDQLISSSEENLTLKDDDQESFAAISLYGLFYTVHGIVAGLGAMAVGLFSAEFGYKPSFRLCAVLNLAAAVVKFLAVVFDLWPLLMLGFVLAGVAAGGVNTVVVAYYSSIATLDRRGFFGVTFSIAIRLGFIVAGILGIDVILGGYNLFKYVEIYLFTSYLPTTAVCLLF